jgi:hypothetical protein
MKETLHLIDENHKSEQKIDQTKEEEIQMENDTNKISI